MLFTRPYRRPKAIGALMVLRCRPGTRDVSARWTAAVRWLEPAGTRRRTAHPVDVRGTAGGDAFRFVAGK